MFAAKPTNVSLSVAQLSRRLQLDYQGDGEHLITSVASLANASSSDLCFIRNAGYARVLSQSACGAAIVPEGFDAGQTVAKTLLFSTNPHFDFIRVAELLQLYRGHFVAGDIHPSAIISASAKVAPSVSIGANAVIGDRVELGEQVQIGAGCIIEDDVVIGANSKLLANVTVCFGVTLGCGVILQPGVVIGGDGFGLVWHQGGWKHIPHLGSVRLGDDVEVGANTTIDRGALDDTVIERGVKIDNQIQIAHNVRIGENTAIAAGTGIAGSTHIGKNCKISGAVGIVGHIRIADGVTITAKSLVTHSIPHAGVYSSGTPLMENSLWKRNAVRFKSLDKLAKVISRLKK